MLRTCNYFSEDGGEVGILCHSTDEEESLIQGVSLPKGVKEASLVRVQCKGDDFKSLDTGKTVTVEKVSCTGNPFLFPNVVFVFNDQINALQEKVLTLLLPDHA